MWLWHFIADSLHMSVRRAKREITPREFLRWQIYFVMKEEDAAKKEWQGRSRSDDYAAQIAYEIYELKRLVHAMFAKTPMDYRTFDKFHMKYALPDESKVIEEVTPEKSSEELGRERMMRSKAAWGAAAAFVGGQIKDVSAP